MQENVTINLTVPKEIVPSLMSFIDAIKKMNGNEPEPIRKETPTNVPTEAEVVNFCRERNSPVDGRRFYSWCCDNNWIDKKGNPITDWKAQIIKWESYRVEKPVSATTNKFGPPPKSRDFTPTDF